MFILGGRPALNAGMERPGFGGGFGGRPVATPQPYQPSPGIGVQPQPVGVPPPTVMGNPGMQQPIATPERPVFRGSFDKLKKTKTIKRGGMYKLKAGEKVVPLKNLARAK